MRDHPPPLYIFHEIVLVIINPYNADIHVCINHGDQRGFFYLKSS